MRLPLPKLKTVAEAYSEAADLLETNPEKAYWILRKIVKLGNNHDIVLGRQTPAVGFTDHTTG
jgi:hypothetical protein